MRKIIIFLSCYILFVCFYACDLKVPVDLNNKRVYKLTCNDNQIEFKATGLMATRYEVKIKSLKGDFDFYADSLKIVALNPTTKVDIEFKYDNRLFTGHQVIEKNKILNCIFRLNIDYGKNHPKEIFILPSGFIMCDGKPLMTDTIRIR